MLDWAEVALLVLMAPLFVFPAPTRNWLFFIFPLIWGVRRTVRENICGELNGTNRRGTIIDAAVLIIAVQLFVSCFIVPDLESSRSKIVGIVYGILVFFALIRIMRKAGLIKIGLAVFLLGGLASNVAGLMGMYVFREPFFKTIVDVVMNKMPRRNWAFQGAEQGINPNALAGVMVLFVPLCLVLAFGWTRKLKAAIAGRVVLGMFSIFFLAGLFLTQSIGSWLALASGVWIVLPSVRAKALSAILFGALAFLVSVVLPARSPALPSLSKSFFVSKIEARYKLWEAGIEAIIERPATGIGLNQLRTRPGIGYENSHAHNQLLHTAAELGIPGLVTYLAILAGAMFACWRIWSEAEEGWMRLAARGLGAGQLAFFSFGLDDAIPLGAKPGIFFWVSLALIMALYNLMRKQKNAGERGKKIAEI